ncbi:MAG: HAMP domain-containing protein [Oscillospiraceae bacterium]|nr:HAMP domain-containing protein [Oscillospiraceae bacterium]
MTVTFGVLLFLNIYCSQTSQQIFYQSKEASMIEKCQLAASELSSLEVINRENVSETISGMESLRVTRLIVTDQAGQAIYDSWAPNTAGKYVLFPEVVEALGCNDVFTWRYHDGVMHSQAAVPMMYYGTLTGCVYMMEYDAQQGSLIRSLQANILTITVVLELVVILFSLFFARAFSTRMRRIMASMRIIQEGDYTHKVNLGGHDELSILGSEINDLTDRLQTSEAKRRQFVSDASHELKTPLASIKLLTDSILQNEMDQPTVMEFVEDIGKEADRLNRMSQKLLSLSKAESQEENESEIIRMAPTAERVVRMLTGIAEKSQIRIETDLSGDCPVLIQEDDLYQIIFNLVENGIKYNTPGGTLTLTLQRDEDNAMLKVTDTGVGIPTESIGHIFERFYRVDKARSRKSGGSGLGLSIVRGIVERNNGTILVESALGQGTTFTVYFPAFDTEETEESAT